MPSRYEPKTIEPKWQKKWQEVDLFRTREDPSRPKFYGLDFFPYPSGHGLSVGHLRNYIPTDVLCRMKYMQGHNVLHPMGWDAFGLPAENEALAKKVHPAKIVPLYAQTYKKQMNLVGISYDWSREINSSTPEYYRWTQWIFLLLYKKGLAYHAEYPANWCPQCQTVLANEEVEGGNCWRCGTPVTKKNLRQWFFKITAYAERLLQDLDELNWPEGIKMMQRNWIGKSEGVEFEWKIADSDLSFRAFTTRIDTVFGATFCVLSPEHPLVSKITTPEYRAEIENYIQSTMRLSEQDRLATERPKTGVFTGAYAIHPFTGNRVPIWVSDYVLMTYGTGAIMAVPGHDERDYDFARRYGLEIVRVIRSANGSPDDLPYTSEDGIMVNSGEFSGLPCREGQKRLAEWMEKRGIGVRRVNYRLRDWLISRQRFWGTPIPIVHCERCGLVPVPENELPVRLPEIESYEPTGTGESPLAGIPEWVNVQCPACGGAARRETDTMGTFACSSWYFLRFCDPHNNERAWDPEKAAKWMPVDCYVGGAEHAVMHLLYARFWNKVFYDEGLVPCKEPFQTLRNQGMLLALTPYRKPRENERLKVGEEGILITFEEAAKLPKEEVFYKWEKMSKSKGNVVTPDEAVEKYGADALRVYELFEAPFEQTIQWSEERVQGAIRFLHRVFKLTDDWRPHFVRDWREQINTANLDSSSREMRNITHTTIEKVTKDIENFSFNTAVATLMEFTNVITEKIRSFTQEQGGLRLAISEAVETLILLLAPIAPHCADEIWESYGFPGFTYQANFPKANPDLLTKERVTIVLQVNGRVRANIEVPTGTSREELERLALSHERVQQFIDGKKVQKVVVVPDKLVNVVAK